MKVKRGDLILITAGKDRGKQGKIEKVNQNEETVVIPGLNIYKRHLKKRDEKMVSGIIEFSRPIPVANISLLCPKCKKPTRVGYIISKNEKMRICKKCQNPI